MASEFPTLDVRPYQIMCLICRVGSSGSDPYYFDGRLDEILDAMRKDPNVPVRLRCYSDTNFAFQNPGHEHDTPEGKLFNEKRDLDILHLLGMVPGDTRPAFELLNRFIRYIPTCAGVCGYGQETSPAWKGCRLAESGNYERGVEKGVRALIPSREPDEMAQTKAHTAAAMYEAKELTIRPHHLMCMACFHGGRETLEPIAPDNLYEAIDICQENPEMPIRLVPGPCMICPPCTSYHPPTGLCVKGMGAGLRDEWKDVLVLQILGLEYGDVLPAREIYERLLARVPSTRDVCGYGDGIVRAPEWTICGGPDGSPGYAKARAVGLGIPGVPAFPASSGEPPDASET